MNQRGRRGRRRCRFLPVAIAPGVAFWLASLPVGPRQRPLSIATDGCCAGRQARRGGTTRLSSPTPTCGCRPTTSRKAAEPQLARRTSPTNIGMTLLSTLAAHDLGYLTTDALVERLDRTLTTLEGLERTKATSSTGTTQRRRPRSIPDTSRRWTAATSRHPSRLRRVIDGCGAPQDRTQRLRGLCDTVELLVLSTSSSAGFRRTSP